MEGNVAVSLPPSTPGAGAPPWLQGLGPRGVWALIRLSITFPWTTLLVAGVVTAVAVWYTATHLTFQASRDALVSPKAPYIQREKDIDQDFADLEAFIVAIEPQRFERGTQFVAALTTRLRADTQHFTRVVDHIGTQSL